MKKVLITGAGGIVGRYIAEALFQAGYEVSGLSRNPETARKKNPDLEGKISWIQGDVLDVAGLEKAFQDAEILVHAAGLVSFQPSDRDLLMKINAEGTGNVVNASLASGTVKKLIHISSVGCLSPGKPMPCEVDERQGFNPDKNTSDYAVSKYAAEMEVYRGIEEGLPAMILNPSIVLAPGGEEESSAALIHYAKKRRLFYPSGWINYVDARDLARILAKAIEVCPAEGERIVVSGGHLSYHNFFSLVAGQRGIKPPVFETGPVLSGLAWRMAALWSFLSGKKPLLTRHTANSASKRFIYKGIAFRHYLGEFPYTSIQDTIEWVIDKKS